MIFPPDPLNIRKTSQIHWARSRAVTLLVAALFWVHSPVFAEEAQGDEIAEKIVEKINEEVQAGSKELKEGWDIRAFAGISLTQVEVSHDNDSVEGDSLQWAVNLDGEAKLLGKAKDWRSKLRLEYGKTESDKNGSFESLDSIALDSIYTLRLKGLADPYASLAFRAVFTDFLRDPRVYTGTLGFGKFLIYEKDESLVVRVGAAFRDVDGDFSVGIESSVVYDQVFAERVSSRVELKSFNEYDFKGADVTGEAIIWLKLSSVVSLKMELKADFNYLPEDNRLDEFGTLLSVPVWPNDIRVRETMAVVIGYSLL